VLWAQRTGLTARIVKYDANRAAKNISSLDSQMMVPTLTMLGRSWCPWSLEAGIVVEAVATGLIMTRALRVGHPDPPVSRTLPGSLLPVSDSHDAGQQRRLRVLVYSDDVNVRQQVILALGRRPHPDLPELTYVEVATEAVVLANMDAGGVDLAILDGEAAPAGGMGIAKQLKDEIYRCPPILVLTGRPQDAWLATWSRAEAAVPHPIDPMRLAEAVTKLLRPRAPATATTP
jgi:hypothetical protein